VSAFEFLRSDATGVVARSPMERQAAAAGARLDVRDGWNVAVSYPDDGAERDVSWADVSHLRKLEVHGRHELTPGMASRVSGAWWCPVTRDRTLVIGSADASSADAIEVTTALAAIAIVGPLAREVLARFCALDLRPQSTPVGGFRPGSVARTPGYVLREDSERYLVLFGWALGEYLWTVVSDAATALGGAPIGVDALDREAARA
jgi:glycine cleavage system aminomethyltransferase T